MNLQDQVIYRCIHAACARPLPRKVNFCPYCGTGQHDGVINHMHVARPVQAAYVAPPEAAAPAPAPAAPAAPAARAAQAPSPPPAAAAPAAAKPAARAAPTASPPRREPVRLRYWLLALGALWLIWIYAKPSSSRIESRIESAILATEECRFNDAQSELIALRMTKATPEQLKRLQSAINAAAPGCEKKKQRAKAWTDTVAAVDAALVAGDTAKAQASLAKFTRRWDDDAETRKLGEKISAQKAAEPRPVPVPDVPQRSSSQSAQSVRNLIDEAERAIKAGNYKSASDKLETCITMVDAGNRECASFKVHADKLQRDLERCLSGGGEWYNDRCH